MFLYVTAFTENERLQNVKDNCHPLAQKTLPESTISVHPMANHAGFEDHVPGRMKSHDPLKQSLDLSP